MARYRLPGGLTMSPFSCALANIVGLVVDERKLDGFSCLLVETPSCELSVLTRETVSCGDFVRAVGELVMFEHGIVLDAKEKGYLERIQFERAPSVPASEAAQPAKPAAVSPAAVQKPASAPAPATPLPEPPRRAAFGQRPAAAALPTPAPARPASNATSAGAPAAAMFGRRPPVTTRPVETAKPAAAAAAPPAAGRAGRGGFSRQSQQHIPDDQFPGDSQDDSTSSKWQTGNRASHRTDEIDDEIPF